MEPITAHPLSRRRRNGKLRFVGTERDAREERLNFKQRVLHREESYARIRARARVYIYIIFHSTEMQREAIVLRYVCAYGLSRGI